MGQKKNNIQGSNIYGNTVAIVIAVIMGLILFEFCSAFFF